MFHVRAVETFPEFYSRVNRCASIASWWFCLFRVLLGVVLHRYRLNQPPGMKGLGVAFALRLSAFFYSLLLLLSLPLSLLL